MPRRLLSTHHLAVHQPNDVISIMAGPLKLAGFIAWFTQLVVHPAVFIQPVIRLAVKCEHRVIVRESKTVLSAWYLGYFEYDTIREVF